jgi:predicted dehydrogenase
VSNVSGNIKRRTLLGAGLAGATGLLVASRCGSNFLSCLSDPIPVAIIGAGGHGNLLTKHLLKRQDVRIHTVVDPDLQRAHKLAAKIEAQTTYRVNVGQDLRHVNDCKDIDAVFIATPHHWHALAAVWAMEAGKHVYIEKPVSHTFYEGQKLVEAAARHKTVVSCGTQLRSNQAVATAIELLKSNQFGEIHTAVCSSYKRRKAIGPPVKIVAPKSVNQDLWLGPAEDSNIGRRRYHYDWHWFWKYGNGGLGNNGVHRIDLARYIMQLSGFGLTVASAGGRLGEADAGETPNTQFNVFNFGDKSIIHELRGVPTSAPKPFVKGDGVVFYSDDCRFAYGGGKFSIYDRDFKLIQQVKGKGSSLGRHIDNFIVAVKNNRPEDVQCPIQEGHYSSGLCHLGSAVHRYSDVGKQRESVLDAVNLNPIVAEQFNAFEAHAGFDVSGTKLAFGYTPVDKILADKSYGHLLMPSYRRAEFAL